MNREEVIRLAREAGWHGIYSKPLMSIRMQEENFLRFAALVAAAEREKCIEVLLSNFDIEDEDVFNVAAAIRERGHVNELAESLTRSDNVLKKDGIRWEVEP